MTSDTLAESSVLPCPTGCGADVTAAPAPMRCHGADACCQWYCSAACWREYHRTAPAELRRERERSADRQHLVEALQRRLETLERHASTVALRLLRRRPERERADALAAVRALVASRARILGYDGWHDADGRRLEILD